MKPYTKNSKISEIYESPLGRDIINKILLQLNKSTNWITNPVVRNLRLSQLKRLSIGKVNDHLIDTLLKMLNQDLSKPKDDQIPVKPIWWKEAVFYQIYPRSFMDANGDGIGDLQGIITKLDYLQKLGITALWLSPVYDSPNDDNGYDIRDYQVIMGEFGTMADFDELLSEVHKRGMYIIMDLVINHTSDEHKWFKAALKDPESPYRDYYFFKSGTENQKPNNWVSFFSGPAWRFISDQQAWVLHLFSAKQIDLNWDNPNLRAEIVTMIKWWLTKGVDGFRMDVINYISKSASLPDGDEIIGSLMEFTGVEQYFYGPHLHQYLHQLHVEAFAPFNAFSVGETPGIGKETGKLLTGDYRQEIDMNFNFDQLETPGHVRFDDYEYDLNYLKQYYIENETDLSNHYWLSIFMENHDNPRMISKVDQRPEMHIVLAKLLATIELTMRGTPFIFQGQELGLTNQSYQAVADFQDIESINKYQELIDEGEPAQNAFNIVLAGSRDHARAPMPWDESDNYGFTKGTPWLKGTYDVLDTAYMQAMSPDSVLSFYQQLIQLRNVNQTLVYGDIRFVGINVTNYFGYYRTLDKQQYFIEINLSGAELTKFQNTSSFRLCLSNYRAHQTELQPYECNIYEVTQQVWKSKRELAQF